jgi:hypothetical protein
MIYQYNYIVTNKQQLKLEIMKQFIKSVFSEMFEGCTPLMAVKRVFGCILILFNLVVMCGADSIDPVYIAICFACSAAVWKMFKLSDAFPDE